MRTFVVGVCLFVASVASAQGWPPPNGATLPSTCTVGHTFWLTTSVSTEMYRCVVTDTWAAPAIGTNHGTSLPGTCTANDTYYLKSGGLVNMYSCTSMNTWTTMGSSLTIGACAPDTVLSVPISTATSGNVQLVALTSGQTVYVCGYNIIAAGTVNVQFVSGTGTACVTGQADRTGTYQLTAQAGIAVPNAGAVQFKGAAGEAVCIELSGAVQVDGLLTYNKF